MSLFIHSLYGIRQGTFFLHRRLYAFGMTTISTAEHKHIHKFDHLMSRFISIEKKTT